MNYISFNQQQIPTDTDGYLLNNGDWTAELAEIIAKSEDIQLTNLHWEVIFFVRDFYQKYNTTPTIRMLIKSMAPKFGHEKANSRYLQKLFPDGPAKQAAKLAGLPKPAKCL